MDFISYSPKADLAYSNFKKTCSVKTSLGEKNLIEKMNSCKTRIHLITQDIHPLKNFPKTKNQKKCLFQLFNAWNLVCQSGEDIPLQIQNWKIIDSFGNPIPNSAGKISSPILRKFNVPEFQDDFFILLTGKEIAGLPLFELEFLCSYYQVQKGFLPIHAAGLIHKNFLFVFSGKSGTGKSTISLLSITNGDKLLDEDQLVLYEKNKNIFSANAWGYSTDSCEFPIRSIFHIHKSNNNNLISLSKPATTKLLIDALSQVIGKQSEGTTLRSAISFASRFARQVPGYELHFRKSPDFWKLIDAEFGLD